MNKAFRILALTAITLATAVLNVQARGQTPSYQRDSTVTVMDEGDTLVSYISRRIDFGSPIVPSEASNKKLVYSEKEKEDLFEAFRKGQREEESRLLNRLRRAAAEREERDRDITSFSIGEIPLASGLSPFGARTYQISIPTVPGIRFAPSISLVYNSQGGDGNAGYGWNIAGIPSITLINKNVYYHGESKAADVHDPADPVFALDGVPIVQNDDPATSQSYPYSTARGHILVSRQLNQQGYVKSFTVLYPNGDKGIFGSVVDDPDSNFPSYPLVRLENIQQDSIIFRYHISNLRFQRDIFSIEYGFDSNGLSRASIHLDYESETDYRAAFYAGVDVSRASHVSRIRCV